MTGTPAPAAPGPHTDVPAAPDGSARVRTDLRRPDPAPIRGPAAGVPDLQGADTGGVAFIEHLRTAATPRDPHEPLPSELARFQHAAERHFARLLDFYGVEWQYEPHEFPIEWDADDRPVKWFRPDFYLPAFDLHIEITTSQQKLVTKKNRKLRLLREHFPQVRCRLFYQRDVLELLRKYGIDASADDDT